MKQIRAALAALPSGSSGKIHICHQCNKHDVWGESWMWYGSIKDLDNGTTTTFCSAQCATIWAAVTGTRATDGSSPDNPY